MTDAELEALTRQRYEYSCDMDYEKAVECWRKAAEQGHGGALCCLGLLYLDGAGVPKDKARAVELFLTAINNGCAKALKYVPKARKTPELCMTAVQNDAVAIRHVPKEMRTADICLEAVRCEGGALRWVPEAQNTHELCRVAVCADRKALKYVPEALKTAKLREAAKEEICG